MTPRRYRSDRRQAARAETRRRIVDSTVALHAEHGALGTTYAMIAERADVSIPTVYNHFPTVGDLLAACTDQAAAHAPALGPEIFAGRDDLDGRLHALVAALFAQYAYYAPWLRWTLHEATRLPELAQWLAQADDRRRQLIVAALEPAFGAAPPPALLALCQLLTGFPAWQQLAGEASPVRAQAQDLLVATLAQLARHHGPGGAPAPSGPSARPKKGTR